MNINLDKIQSTIEGEIEKTTAAERKRIVGLINDFAKDLIEAVKSGGEDSEEIFEEAPAAKSAKALKPAKVAKLAVAEAPAAEEGDGNNDYDITEVDDDEVETSEHNAKKLSELRNECKERELTVPKGYGKAELVKLLILDDEAQG